MEYLSCYFNILFRFEHEFIDDAVAGVSGKADKFFEVFAKVCCKFFFEVYW